MLGSCGDIGRDTLVDPDGLRYFVPVCHNNNPAVPARCVRRILDACYTQCIEEEASPQGEQRAWSEDEASEEEEGADEDDSEQEDDAAMQDAEAAAAAAAAGGGSGRQQRKRPRSAGRGAAAGGQQAAGGDGAGPSSAAAAAAAGGGADAGPSTKRRAQVRDEVCGWVLVAQLSHKC